MINKHFKTNKRKIFFILCAFVFAVVLVLFFVTPAKVRAEFYNPDFPSIPDRGNTVNALGRIPNKTYSTSTVIKINANDYKSYFTWTGTEPYLSVDSFGGLINNSRNDNGTYPVRIKAQNGHSSYAYQSFNVIVGSGEFAKVDVQIISNPKNETVDFGTHFTYDYNYLKSCFSCSEEFYIKVSISSDFNKFRPGTYLVTVKASGQRVNEKICTYTYTINPDTPPKITLKPESTLVFEFSYHTKFETITPELLKPMILEQVDLTQSGYDAKNNLEGNIEVVVPEIAERGVEYLVSLNLTSTKSNLTATQTVVVVVVEGPIKVIETSDIKITLSWNEDSFPLLTQNIEKIVSGGDGLKDYEFEYLNESGILATDADITDDYNPFDAILPQRKVGTYKLMLTKVIGNDDSVYDSNVLIEILTTNTDSPILTETEFVIEVTKPLTVEEFIELLQSKTADTYQDRFYPGEKVSVRLLTAHENIEGKTSGRFFASAELTTKDGRQKSIKRVIVDLVDKTPVPNPTPTPTPNPNPNNGGSGSGSSSNTGGSGEGSQSDVKPSKLKAFFVKNKVSLIAAAIVISLLIAIIAVLAVKKKKQTKKLETKDEPAQGHKDTRDRDYRDRRNRRR